jgi:crotonobetainyl-CoA:carnitine CoA-transferase CaiB-like acyl-CoA transferase
VEPAPLLGAHNEEVLEELLGLDPSEVRALADRGVISKPLDELTT